MSFDVSDLIDIAVITLFIYSILIWFRRTTSRRVVIGICLLAAIYLLARLFDLYLTQLLFRTVFAVLLIALVVVFQDEIRRAFERLAIWGSFRDRRRYAGFHAADALLETVSGLASDRTGALIVVRGGESLDRHVEGGIPLYGKISKPILYSIFDPHSPGHDGAVLIEGDRITKFGAHLPLSKNLAQIGALGTRHSAALGLSECSDAFVIVVSEETGSIRVAREGEMKRMNSVADLKGRLEKYYQDKFPRQAEPDWKRFLRENAGLKVLALGLAVLSWFLFAYRSENVQRTFAVPIEYRNLPAGWALEGVKTPEAMVTLTGSQREFNLLNPSNLVISFDLSKMPEGINRLNLTEDELRHPVNLQVYRIEPSGVTVEMHKTSVISVPVEVRTKGKLPAGVRLVSLKALPSTVRVRVRIAPGDGVGPLLTEPVDLGDVTRTVVFTPRLQLPDSMQMVEPDAPVVRVTVEVAQQ